MYPVGTPPGRFCQGPHATEEEALVQSGLVTEGSWEQKAWEPERKFSVNSEWLEPLILVFLLSSSRDVGGLSSGAGRGLALEELRSESNHLRACPGYQHRTFCLPESPNPRTDNPDLWGSQVARREYIYLPCALGFATLLQGLPYPGPAEHQGKPFQTKCTPSAHWHRHTHTCLHACKRVCVYTHTDRTCAPTSLSSK